MTALGTLSDGAATARAILGAAVTHRTAAGYNRSCNYFADFCAANGWPALPTTDAALSCYFGSMCDRNLKPSTMRSYLTSINNMHVAKGYPKPAAGAHVSKLRKGWARIVADRTKSLPAARGPLPADLVLDIVHLAGRTADPECRRRYVAVILCFLVCRRTIEVLELQLQDVSVLPDGSFYIEVNRFKNAEARPDPHRLVYTIPTDPKIDNDDVLPLLRGMVNELRAEAAPPNRMLFSTASLDRPPSPDDVTVWLHKAMDALNASPPPGVLYSSYSCRAGGATALYIIGVPLVAVAAMLGHKDNDTRTAIANYVSVSAPFSSPALRLCGRWLRPAA